MALGVSGIDDDVIMGRREANKLAVRDALRTAAAQLFAQRGYEATTVRDIARAAMVTERTFYRYFGSKDGLIAEGYLRWLAALQSAIADRPAAETMPSAVRAAMISVARESSRSHGSGSAWIAGDAHLTSLQRSGIRPLLQFEDAITAALAARCAPGADTGNSAADAEHKFRAQVVARAAVAAFRTAAARHRELSEREAVAPPLWQLVDRAFTVMLDPPA